MKHGLIALTAAVACLIASGVAAWAILTGAHGLMVTLAAIAALLAYWAYWAYWFAFSAWRHEWRTNALSGETLGIGPGRAIVEDGGDE
jgi:hypothetical protein